MDSREQFETWFKHNYQWFIKQELVAYGLQRSEGELQEYVWPIPNHDWRVWQASRDMNKSIAVRKMGRYGAAYDMPEDRRAYSYRDQPDNVGASRLADALRNVRPGGDSIDHGLSLLKALQDAGFGIFELEQEPC